MEEVVLCGASAYNKKFYLNESFTGLPVQVRDELKIMCAPDVFRKQGAHDLKLVSDMHRKTCKALV